MRTARFAVPVLLAWLGVAASAFCQSFPNKPVHIVVPFPPGGGVDVFIRAVAPELTARWNQPVLIDNKSGAGGVMGVDSVAKAVPDGYTLLATTNPVIATSRFLYKSLPFDADKNLAPVALMAGAAQLLVANSAVPANNLKELVALARAQPGKVAYGTDGIGSLPHQVYAMLSAGERIETTHVAYRGIAPAFAALLANEVQLSGASVAVAGTLLKAGRIKALAVAGPGRLVQFPNVPTTTEQGFPALKASIWFALFVPAGVAQPVIEKIAADVIAILKQPEFAQRHATDKGLEMFAGGPAQLLAAIREDVASSGMMVKAAGIIPE